MDKMYLISVISAERYKHAEVDFLRARKKLMKFG